MFLYTVLEGGGVGTLGGGYTNLLWHNHIVQGEEFTIALHSCFMQWFFCELK